LGLLGLINRIIGWVLDSIAACTHRGVVVWLVPWAALQASIVWALWSFPDYSAQGAVSALMSLFPEDTAAAFRHYPQHLELLPSVFGWTRLVLGLLCEGLVVAAVAGVVVRFRHDLASARACSRSGLNRWFSVSLVWAVSVGAVQVTMLVAPAVIHSIPAESAKLFLLLRFVVLPGICAGLLAALASAIPCQIAFGQGLGASLGASVRALARHPLASLVTSVPLVAALVVAGLVTDSSGPVAARWGVEAIPPAVLGAEILRLCAVVFWASAGTGLIPENTLSISCFSEAPAIKERSL